MKLVLLLLCSLIIPLHIQAQTCPNRIPLKIVPASNRQGIIIYKSNWNIEENREQTIEEGNHSQKGAALLINYKQKKYIPNKSSIEIRDLNCKIIGYLGRFPRCTQIGCGDWERWYSRSPGGSYLTPMEISKKALSPSVLVRIKDRHFVVIQNVLSAREIKK